MCVCVCWFAKLCSFANFVIYEDWRVTRVKFLVGVVMCFLYSTGIVFAVLSIFFSLFHILGSSWKSVFVEFFCFMYQEDGKRKFFISMLNRECVSINLHVSRTRVIFFKILFIFFCNVFFFKYWLIFVLYTSTISMKNIFIENSFQYFTYYIHSTD